MTPADDDDQRPYVRDVLERVLADSLEEPGPEKALRAFVTRMAASHHDAGSPYEYLRNASGLDANDIADDITEPLDLEDIWVTAAASIVEPIGQPRWTPLPAAHLTARDWLVIAMKSLDAYGTSLSAAVLMSELERSGAGHVAPHDEVMAALEQLCTLWQALGAITDKGRLTLLGRWGIARAVIEAYEDDEDAYQPTREEQMAEVLSQLMFEWNDAPGSFDAAKWAIAAGAAGIGGSVLELAVADDLWEDFLPAMYGEVEGQPLAVGPAFLLALRAEHKGDLAKTMKWIDVAIEADPTYEEALYMGAELAGLVGDAPRAMELLRQAGVDQQDGEYALYARYSRRADGAQSRNAPCACGSGKKYKLCCGARVGHPLEARGNWIWRKVSQFIQRPAHRDLLMSWGALRVGTTEHSPEVVEAAYSDLLVADFVFFDADLRNDFLTARGPLLPADERSTVESWGDTARSAYEVTAVRSGFAVTVRDLLGESTCEVTDRLASQQLRKGDIVIARVLPLGQGWMFGLVMPVNRMMRASLVDLLSSTSEPEPLAAWLLAASRPPEMQTTEGEPLMSITQQWEVSDEMWEELRTELDEDQDGRLTGSYTNAAGTTYVRGTLARKGDVVTLTTNSDVRAERFAELLLEVGAQLVSDNRQTFEEMMRRPHLVSEPEAPDPEIQQLLEAQMRQHEQRWVDDQIPMFGGRTPRDMVKTVDGRHQVEAFLEDMRVQAEHAWSGPEAMSADRIAGLLGLAPA